MRFVVANLVLFIIYCTGICAFDWMYVRLGQPHDEVLFLTVEPLLIWSAVPVTCAVNTWLVQAATSFRRVLIGTMVALLAIAVAFVPLCLLLVHFHVWIGGSL
jgi:Na+-driven multidrug efflux pump